MLTKNHSIFKAISRLTCRSPSKNGTKVHTLGALCMRGTLIEMSSFLESSRNLYFTMSYTDQLMSGLAEVEMAEPVRLLPDTSESLFVGHFELTQSSFSHRINSKAA